VAPFLKPRSEFQSRSDAQPASPGSADLAGGRPLPFRGLGLAVLTSLSRSNLFP